jgi:uncharacterized membrane protein
MLQMSDRWNRRMSRQHWKGVVGGIIGAAFVVGFLLHDLFPARVAYAAQTVVIVSSLLFGGLFFLMFVFACLIPLFTLVTKGRKAAEYEWRRLWWVK